VKPAITGATMVVGVAGAPVTHSLSPIIHNAWIEAAGLDAVYAPFAPPADGFAAFAAGLRGGAVRGLNVTVPFKETALAAATRRSERAERAGSANLLLFQPGGAVFADNTDGEGLLAALRAQAPGYALASAPAVILGAGGAARGAAAALLDAGCPEVRLVNRTVGRAETLAATLGSRVRVTELSSAPFSDAGLIVNATSLGLGGGAGPAAPFQSAPAGAVVLDMVYRPLRTEFLARASGAGLATVDGLAMLIGQAAPSFEAFFGRPAPDIDVRALCLAALGESA
jgi:shikimate dehydrogenase